ncbi:hypothetical protein KCU64_g9653, partial [Aureobasidium melanogenum]
MFAYDGIDDLVRLLQDLYRTKDAIAVNNATKSKASLGANDTDAPACDVALRFKDLQDAQETTGAHDLESQLDQKQLGAFARLYLRNRGKEKRLRKTIDTRTKFLARHFLEVLGFGKDGGHTKNRFAGKTRMVKAQRMTAKAVNLLADVFGSGSLLLMWRSV